VSRSTSRIFDSALNTSVPADLEVLLDQLTVDEIFFLQFPNCRDGPQDADLVIERKSGNLTAPARIGRVRYSETGATIYYRGKKALPLSTLLY
jgi:hypothetical protein